MENAYRSLAHSNWECKSHVLFVPNRRPRPLYGQRRRQVGALFPALARQKAWQSIAGHVRPEHGPMGIALPPKGAVAQGSGFWKGKRARAMARQVGGKERNFPGEPFWARGSAVSPVGFELEQVRADIRNQDDEDPDEGGKF
jgi:REP-associated tyrosine transposase